VCHIFAVNSEFDRSTLRERDFVRRKGETFSGNLDDWQVARAGAGSAA